MTNFQIGAQMYSVRNHCQNADEMLLAMKALKAMGYNTCQLSGYNRAIPAEQLKDMLDESGLTCICTQNTSSSNCSGGEAFSNSSSRPFLPTFSKRVNSKAWL